ncbi:MAG: hypothetical protein WCS85_03535 [Candidatus Peribacteraceae bacterium]|jgi:hypothetical protein
MRSLLLLALVGYAFLAFRMPVNAETAGESVSAASRQDVRTVLHLVERASILGAEEECGILSPLPLYEHSPSADDWTSFCSAMVKREPERCAAISGTIIPDLHAFCSSIFS